MELYPITKDLLATMQDILNESAGYSVSLVDELEYFDPASSDGWFLAVSGNKNVAFIRYFKQNSEWSLAELYVNPKVENRSVIAALLLEKFERVVRFPKGHRLRFDIKSDDQDLNSTLKNAGFSERTQTFKHFEWFWRDEKIFPEYDAVFLADAKEVAEVLSYLHPVTEEEAQKWIEKQTIRVVRVNGRIATVAQVYESHDATEVNRFATHEMYLRKGFAKKLMSRLLSESQKSNKKHVYLKVENTRLPAIAFYQSMEFSEKSDKCQTWHSRWY